MTKSAFYEKIARDLLERYYNYYCTVYFGFIVEAVENAVDDLGTFDREKLHEHIIENYI